MSSNHKYYHYSATCKTYDAAVLHCLRALCQYSESGEYPQIGWGGTKRSLWEANNGSFTVRFTSPSCREQYISEATRLLKGHWELLETSDNDPAEPQR